MSLRSLPPGKLVFRSRLHDERVSAILGIALGISFGICFATGLISHLIQNPKSWFEWPAAPRDLYRVITATHVVTGFASVPLLLAKLWTVFPKLWRWPLFRNWPHAIERLSLIPLVGGSLFLFAGGIDDSMYVYVNPFTFTPTHYMASWVTVGALIIHIAAHRAATLRALRRQPDPVPDDAPDATLAATPATATTQPATDVAAPATDPADRPTDPAVRDRRRFLATVGVASGVIGVNFLAANVSPLFPVALLTSRRSDVHTQGLPVQTRAPAAGVAERIMSPDYRLRIIGNVPSTLELTVEDLLERAGHEAGLPISCVQGWSVGATWRGVRVRDLLREAGVTDFNEVIVRSIQTTTRPKRMFGRARLNPAHALHPDTLLATELNGSRLHVDHGYPIRLIAPNNPGIMQTKWVEELLVR